MLKKEKKKLEEFEELNFKSMLSILSKSQKKRYYLISIFNFITMILEVLGLALVFPIISIILDKQKLENYQKIFSEYEFLNFLDGLSHKNLVVFVLILLVSFFLIKNVANLIISYFKGKIFFGLIASISSSMFNGYTEQNLSFSIKQNSAYIIRNIIDQPSIFVHHTLQGIYYVIFESLFIICTLTIFVLANQIIGLSIIFVALTFFLIFYYLSKYKIKSYGRSLNSRYAERLKITRESIEGIQDILLYNKKEYFEKIFTDHTYRIVGLTSILAIREQLPRNVLEFFAVFCISIIIIYFFNTGMTGYEIIPIVSLIAIGLLRIIPSFTKIMSSIIRIKASIPIVENLSLELNKFRKIHQNKNTNFDYNKNIEIKNLKFYYDKEMILDNINFKIHANKIFGIKGVSGSGKTTLLNLIIGFLNPSEGSIEVNGKEISENIKNWQKNVSYVPQKIFLSDDSLKNNISFETNENLIDKDKLDTVINISQLNSIKNEDLDLDKKIGESGKKISSGQAQRVAIARALFQNPKILILDEATSALDKKTENKIFDSLVQLKNKGMTIVIISHDPNLFKFCDSYYDLDKKETISVK